MSNNNPHSHINQTAQNSSWNPLQIPSYIPRQPQLAHMSNERPMVRSPLAWHAAAPPPESLYNFMSAANHKNLEHSMNPLLPPYVRGPPPFDSMDLSLQSNRSSSSPLNKNAHALLQPLPPAQLDYGHKQAQHQHNLQQQTQQQMHGQNNYPIHNLSTSTAQSQQHTAVSIQNVSSASVSATTQSSSAQNSNKFLSSNGSDCEQPSSLIQTSQASSLSSNNGSNYQRHSAENYVKMSHMSRSFENDSHSKPLQKPVELVNKDCSYNAMLSNKLQASHLQQQTSKKHSPLRSGGSSYHVPQSPQQSPFNSPAPASKHNGPHTPPTPQSPGMHQTQSPSTPPTQQQLQTHQTLLHGGGNANAGVLDYNQLHLQQPLSSYTQTHLQQQQHLHHAYPQPQHHQHWQQQQPTPPPPPPPNAVSLASQHHQQASQAHMQPPQMSSPHQHQQPQQQRQSHHSSLSNMEPASSITPIYAVNTETNFEQRNMEHQKTIVPLPATCTSPRRDRIPDSAESPDTNASSNDDDSCDGKTTLRKQNSKKSPQQTREYKSPNSVRPEGKDSPLSSTSVEIEKNKLNIKSPKSSPSVHQRKSPQKHEIGSPKSLDLSAQRPASLKHIQSAAANITSPPSGAQQQDDSETDSVVAERQPMEILKNGCTPPEHLDTAAEGEVETIDKIAEMIAKTASNSSHSSNSNDANSNSSSKSTRVDMCESPKTKKQRQALKLRNAEHNTDWSANSNHDSNTSMAQTTTETTSIPLATNDDNAVLAEELRKDATPPPISPRKQPMSPQTNSRSSSSSSSSSSCSNSSRSSCGSKSQKSKPSTTVDAVASEGNLLKIRSPGKENVCDSDMAKIKIEDNQTFDNQPLNLNCKTSVEAIDVPTTPASPDKSSFEEVENKLEEMFAGIEDEPPLEGKTIEGVVFRTTPLPDNAADAAAVATDLSAALELSNSLKDRTINCSLGTAPIKTLKSPSVHAGPIQTKAAKKSTVPSPVKLETPSPNSPALNASIPNTTTEITNDISKSGVSASPSVRKPTPRRRLSVALDPSNLRLILESTETEASTSEQEKTKINKRELFVQLDSTTTANDDINTITASDKNRTNKGNRGTSTTSTSKMRTGSAPNTSTVSGAKTNSKPSGKKNKQNQPKAVQQKRRKQSSSDEDVPPANARDPAASTSNANANNEKFKSPFVLVKRDGSVSVVNTATAEDIGNDKQTKTKKPPASYSQHERRNIRGFHSSTLSQKYDADTTDSTWICVFCKRGPHRMGLGDLFGPYLVTINCEEYKNAINAPDTTNVDEEFISKRRRMDMVQCNSRGPPVVMATKAQEALAAANRTNKKKKKSVSEASTLTLHSSASKSLDPLEASSNTFLGMNKVSEKSYEVWLHEDCTVWAPDVFLVGARIMGLESAVWNSTRYQCVFCIKSGATVCCLERGCKAAAHVPCAREALWQLDESNWHVHCPVHIKSNSNATICTPTAASLTSTEDVRDVTQCPSTSIS